MTSRSSTAVSRREVGLITRRLRNEYGDYAHGNRKNPLDELVFIMLSIRTREMVNHRVFREYKRQYPTFENVLSGSIRQLESVFEPAGLANQRAARIREVFKQIKEDFGIASLARLHRWNDEEVEGYLRTLPGIGVKTARCIMMYSLDREVFPVDSNCWRIACRLGWFHGVGRYAECSHTIMDDFQNSVPANLRFSLHVNMVSLGRKICKAVSPRCDLCVLADRCPSASLL